MIGRLYSLALMLAALVLALAPLHAHFTRHLDVVRTLPDHRIELAGAMGLEAGDVVPILRHNPSWTLPIGYATVEEVDGATAIATWDPESFRWPMGRHATVVEVEGKRVVVDLGAGAGAEPGLVLMRRGLHVRLESVDEDRAEGVVLGRTEATPGARLSEFRIRTRAHPLGARWLVWVEGALLLGLLAVWGLSCVHPGPGRVWARVAASLRALGSARLALDLVLAPVVPIVLVPVAYWSVTWLVGLGFPTAGLQVAKGVGLAAYLGWLAVKRTSPLLALWNALGYRPRKLDPRLLWVLHLVVAYAFASTLTGFLQGNVRAIGDLLVETPDIIDLLLVARYALWSLTICGCLLGYGHTILSILWKPEPLRGLDFTAGGWLFNAICYGPLLGGVLHHLLPDGVGAEPTVTEGPLFGAMLGAELLLNALYTASIWNLGTMFGVMADKGVRTTGFYAVVRHPSYTLEPLMFCVLMLPGFTGPAQWLVALSFVVKYWLRAERDDQFLGRSNPAYPPYRDQVPWKMIPGLY